MLEEHESLAPSFERLLVIAFANLAPGPVTVLTPASAEDSPRFEPPATWRVSRATRQTLAGDATKLLEQGPVLLVPPWHHPVEVGQKARRSFPPSFAYGDVLRACRPGNPDSRMAVLTPVDLWVYESPHAVELRTALAEHWDTTALVISEGTMPHVHRSLVVALAFLQAKQERQLPMKMFQVPRGADDEAVERDFDALLKRGGGSTQHGYVLRELPSPAESLDFDRHHPDVTSGRADLAGFGSLTTLSELYEAVPRVHMAGDSQWITKDEVPGAVRLLRGRDILREGSIALVSDDSLWVTSPPRHLLQPGDLLLREIRGRHDLGGLMFAEVTEQDLPAAPAHTTIALRPRSTSTPQQIRLVAQFLRTPLADRLVGRSGLHLLTKRLMALPVPQPDDALTTALDDLDAARTRLESWTREADALLESAFTHKTAAQARERIIDQGRGLRQRVEAATLLDDLGHTVRTRFPLPVAYRWREAETRMSAGEHQATYSAILETAEILLCYTALLTLALAWEAGISLGSTIAIREKLVGGRSGPGLGDWANVLLEAAGSRKLRALPHQHPIHAIRTLLVGQDAAAARERLTKRRNDDSHLRRLDPIDLPPAITEAFADLTVLVDRARFLADLPLWHVTETRWDNLTQAVHVSYRELTGDHPVVPTKSAVLPRNDLEPGSLYLRDSMHQLHLLRPFLTGQVCRVCRAWSTFHADIVPGDVVQLKSLEHGHVLHETAVARHALSIVGLL